MPYVITCADEGVQVNEGTRLGFVGAGYKLPYFSQAVAALTSILEPGLRIAASEECDWMREKLELSNWEQVTASSQQHIEALADKEGLLYAGFIPFADPKGLKHDIKAHMVRPKNVHIANKICFTLAGGEQTYNLGCFLLSAEWLHAVPEEVATELIKTQIAFLQKLSGRTDLQMVLEEKGALAESSPEVVAQNKSIIQAIISSL